MAKTLVSDKYLWEILVPTQRSDHTPIRTRCHKQWDTQVRRISGGLTILKPAKGQWVTPEGDLFQERMIPVRIMCSDKDIERIADMTAKHYDQRAVMFYRLTDHVQIKHYK